MRITEGIYPAIIARCEHIRTNGIQCNCPALKNRHYCYFHSQWHTRRKEKSANDARRAQFAVDLPLLEDANSVQVALMRVMHALVANQIDAKKAALLMYGLQTAALNVRRTRFEPAPNLVVIDADDVANTCLGDNAWYKQEFTPKKKPTAAEKKKKAQEAAYKAKMDEKAREIERESNKRLAQYHQGLANRAAYEKSLKEKPRACVSLPPPKPPTRINGESSLPLAKQPAPN